MRKLMIPIHLLHFPTVRLCLSLSIICNWEIKFSDVSAAFLHADTLGIPYVYPPDTEKLQDTTKVWKLKKALYGLKSWPKAWYQHIVSILSSLGWERCYKDECVFILRDKKRPRDKQGRFINSEINPQTHVRNVPLRGIIVVYVDDLIAAGQKAVVNNFFGHLKRLARSQNQTNL